MADPTHLKNLLAGDAAWKKWLKANWDTDPDLAEADLFLANLQGTNLAGADLHATILFRADLAGADLSVANLQGANLRLADLQGATLAGADLVGADLCGANLEEADVSFVRFDRCSRQRGFRGIRVSTCHGSQVFKSFAQDQDYIEELRSSGWRGWVIFWLWYIFADCGRSFTVWASWSLGLATGFGYLFYFWIGPEDFKFDHLPTELSTMIYYSVVTFTTLGFGDIKPVTWLASLMVMVEVIVGYVMLGGLISIFANKVARRA